MKNIFREKILRGEKTMGTFFELGSGSAAECIGLAGMDYMIIDCEHGVFDPQSAIEYIRTAKLYNVTPLARPQDFSRASILKLLDAGAMGLILPCVNSVEDAEQIVQYGKYAPLGQRGVSSSAGTGFWFEDYACHGMENIFETANRETMLIPQCETRGCLDNIEKVVALPGVDGIFVGPFDLSAAMGIPGQFDKPEFKDALKHIQRVCAEAKKPSLIFAATEEAARTDLELGYDSITYSLDATLLVNAMKAARKSLLG